MEVERDDAGLSLFCVTGALKALDYGLGPVPAALLGMVTGIGGGIARDVLAGRVPLVFRGELYATPALVGALVAVLGYGAGVQTGVLAVPAAAVCFGWRVLAMRRVPAAGCRVGQHLSAHQNWVPGSPLNGPTTFDVTQPP